MGATKVIVIGDVAAGEAANIMAIAIASKITADQSANMQR